jgi:hypothetical protein
MRQFIRDAAAGQVSAERSRRGVAMHARVHVRVGILESPEPPMAAIAEAGKGFDWLAEAPGGYSDADLLERAPGGFGFGRIILARVPFTDRAGAKRRPAPGFSRDNERGPDRVVGFIVRSHAVSRMWHRSRRPPAPALRSSRQGPRDGASRHARDP